MSIISQSTIQRKLVGQIPPRSQEQETSISSCNSFYYPLGSWCLPSHTRIKVHLDVIEASLRGFHPDALKVEFDSTSHPSEADLCHFLNEIAPQIAAAIEARGNGGQQW